MTKDTSEPAVLEPTATTTELQFMIQRIYTKDLSFEAPNTPAVFQQDWQPDLTIDLHQSHVVLNDETYEVVLHITVTVKNQGQIAFLVEVKQAGIFTIQGFQNAQQLEHLLESFCPGILFPYAREAITHEVTRGSFPQLVLAPINFEALYLNKLATQHSQSSTESIQ
ncbi:MAG: protein-export chaperone SecB [Gammaproteobacteria bacterium]|nr:protein-export chaperone SecB [Gammaproteobacteria bacterium]